MNVRQLFAVLGHELRTPLAAILGYNELLSDGIYGDIPERQREPLARIHHSAIQLVRLLDGVHELSGSSEGIAFIPSAVQADQVFRDVVADIADLAAGRNVVLVPETIEGITLHTSRDRFARLLEMAIIGAVKASPGCTLTLRLYAEDNHAVFSVGGTLLDPERDCPDLDSDHLLTSAAFRLAIAHQTALRLSGSLKIHPGEDTSELRISLPLELT